MQKSHVGGKGHVPETETRPVWQRQREWPEDAREADRDHTVQDLADKFKDLVLHLKYNEKL